MYTSASTYRKISKEITSKTTSVARKPKIPKAAPTVAALGYKTPQDDRKDTPSKRPPTSQMVASTWFKREDTLTMPHEDEPSPIVHSGEPNQDHSADDLQAKYKGFDLEALLEDHNSEDGNDK